MAIESQTLISNNELLQDGATVGGIALATAIKSTLAYYYSKGVRVGEIDIACADYADGAIDWQNDGEIPQVGQFVQFDDNTVWRITGRTFEYSGAPRIHLELQEAL